MSRYEDDYLRFLHESGLESEEDLRRLDEFPPAVHREVLQGLGELAFMCQNDMNLMLGKRGILMLPREWLLTRLDLLLALALASDDYYEYAQISGVLKEVEAGGLDVRRETDGLRVRYARAR